MIHIFDETDARWRVAKKTSGCSFQIFKYDFLGSFPMVFKYEASAPLFCRKKDLLGHVSLGKVTAT